MLGQIAAEAQSVSLPAETGAPRACTNKTQKSVRLALVGIGKIARDQHLPALSNDKGFTLAATVSSRMRLPELATFPDLDALLQSKLPLDAVSVCTPPQGRHLIARAALEAGLHVMMEKPPTATLGELTDLQRCADAAGVTLFATWHSRKAAGVEFVRQWLRTRSITRVRVMWHEDVRKWHPGQRWILAGGGFGVFDPGINALSILTLVLPKPLLLSRAILQVPSNYQAPIAAHLSFLHGDAPVEASFDFRCVGPERWDIEIETDAGRLDLTHGGSRVSIDGVAQSLPASAEYPSLYARFRELIAQEISDVDATPLLCVADAFLLGERIQIDPFEF